MAEIRAMTLADADRLQAMMASEAPAYLKHFTAFAEPGSLLQQCCDAKLDAFFTMLDDDQPSGFFCLRGLDQGYVRPSFGIYVASAAQGRGLARAALQAAQQWCHDRCIPVLMLKVTPNNSRACRLYETTGFIAVRQCPDSEQVVMEKRIV